MFQFNLTDYSPAVYIRNLTQEIIEPYAKGSKFFSHDMLRPLLCEVFGWMEFQVSQELMKVLSFGKEKYIRITIEEMVDYTMEKHLGENAILKYIKKKGYARRDEEIMNKDQFLDTLALGLNYLRELNMSQFLTEFQAIFEHLDKHKVGTISRVNYCLFLKHYLGSESPMSINPTKRVTEISQSQQLIDMRPNQNRIQNSSDYPESQATVEQVIQETHNNYSVHKEFANQLSQNINNRTALQDFKDLIIISIIKKCQQYDENEDGYLNRSECERFMYQVLELELNSIEFIINNYFKFSQTAIVNYKELIEIVSEVHFREIFTNIVKNQLQVDSPNKAFMNKEYFIDKVKQNCYFFPIKPTQQLLQKVFEELLLKSDNTLADRITLDDFRSFILVHCCNNKLIFRHQPKKSTHYLLNTPASIAEAENSHYQEDQSENSSYRPNKKELSGARKSNLKGYENESKERQMEGDIGLSSKRTKNNQLSQQNISAQNESVPMSYIYSSRQFNVNVTNEKIESTESIKVIKQDYPLIGGQNQYATQDRKEQRLKEQKKPFKEVLWRQLQTIIVKYCSSSRSQLSKEECQRLFNSEDIFNEDRLTFNSKINRLFTKQNSASIELITSYIIHLKGQEALLEFNKRQIKGKSTLNESQIAEILHCAYGKLMHFPKEQFLQFSKLLFIQNGKSLFQYRNYLELIARNLSIRNNF